MFRRFNYLRWYFRVPILVFSCFICLSTLQETALYNSTSFTEKSKQLADLTPTLRKISGSKVELKKIPLNYQSEFHVLLYNLSLKEDEKVDVLYIKNRLRKSEYFQNYQVILYGSLNNILNYIMDLIKKNQVYIDQINLIAIPGKVYASIALNLYTKA